MKNYETPEVSIVVVDIEDVITASGIVDVYSLDNNIYSGDLF